LRWQCQLVSFNVTALIFYEKKLEIDPERAASERSADPLFARNERRCSLFNPNGDQA